MSFTRIGAIFRKELRDYRRNSSVVVTMSVIPLIFIISPLVQALTLSASSAASLSGKAPLLYMLGIPALVPTVVAAAAVVAERQQATLEPVLGTPIRREELLIGKAAAVMAPALAVSYADFLIFVVVVEVFAQASVASAVVRGPEVLAQILFTPLVAGWSIWLGIAISARASDVRVASQLALLVSLPAVAVSLLVASDVIHPTLGLALVLGAALLLADCLGWWIVSPMFDRERLITGRPARRPRARVRR